MNTMRGALLLALFTSLPGRAADACSLFPEINQKYGATVAVNVELHLINGSWWGYSLCTKKTIRIRDGYAYANQAWRADLQLEVPSHLLRKLSRVARAAKRTEKRGGFLYITASLTGTVQPLDLSEDHAKLAVTAIQNLNSAEEPPPAKLPVISMCELFKDLPSYDRKRVAVRGEVSGTSEGTWLVPTEKCTQRFVTKGFPWGFDLSFSGVSVPITRRSPRQAISGIFVGIVMVPAEYIVQCRFGELQGLGFGHLGGSPGVFLAETVLHPVVGNPIVANRELPDRVTCPVNEPAPSKQ
jgi:hypothetical protein